MVRPRRDRTAIAQLALVLAVGASCTSRDKPPQSKPDASAATTDVPAWLQGAWSRGWMLRNGVKSTAYSVHYLQTPTAFADVRIPTNLPSFAHATSFADLTDAELGLLAKQRAFAGYTTVSGDTATWHHDVDYQPPDNSPDLGRVERKGDAHLYEHGLDGSYIEAWERTSDGNGRFLALRVARADGRFDRLLVVIGDRFTYVRNRARDLPAAVSLDSLIATTKATRAQIVDYLDCEFSTGAVRGGSVPWEIEESTLPWRRGRHLAFADSVVVSRGPAALAPRGPTALAPRVASGERWAVPANTLTATDLTALFPSQR